VVEGCVRERQPLALSSYQRLTHSQAGGENLGTLIETNDSTAVPTHERSGDHAGATGHIEHAIASFGANRSNERPSPTRILPQREQGRDPLIRRRDTGKQSTGVR
jgi:hypothetical protein